jgi:hypothetical protein
LIFGCIFLLLEYSRKTLRNNNVFRSLPYSSLITGVTRIKRRVRYCLPFRNTQVHPHTFLRFLIFDLSVMFFMFCRSLFVLLYLFFWPFCCLFFFDIQILITLWYLQTLLTVQRSKFERNYFWYYKILPLCCLSSFHCIFCQSSICDFRLRFWYVHTFLRKAHSYDKIILNSDSHQHN